MSDLPNDASNDDIIQEMARALDGLPAENFLKKYIERGQPSTLEALIEDRRQSALYAFAQAITGWQAAEALANDLKAIKTQAVKSAAEGEDVG